MFYQTESKAQGWRAVAVFGDERGEALIVIGRSSTQVRASYVESFMELFDEEEREQVNSIALQRWQGALMRDVGSIKQTLKCLTQFGSLGSRNK